MGTFYDITIHTGHIVQDWFTEDKVGRFCGAGCQELDRWHPHQDCILRKKWSEVLFHNRQQKAAAITTIISMAPTANPPIACTSHCHHLHSPPSSHDHGNTTMSTRAWCGCVGSRRKPLGRGAVIWPPAAAKSPLRKNHYLGNVLDQIPICKLILLSIN